MQKQNHLRIDEAELVHGIPVIDRHQFFELLTHEFYNVLSKLVFVPSVLRCKF